MRYLLPLISLFFASPVLAGFADLNVFVADTLVKYRDAGEDGTTGASSINISMMRNEFESVQLLIYNDTGSAENIEDVEVTGTAIEGEYLQARVYEQRYLTIGETAGSRCDYPYGNIPDPLIPRIDDVYGETRDGADGFLKSGGSAYSLPASKLKGVWIDIGSNIDTPAGNYTLTASVKQAGQSDRTVTINVTVWDVVQPSTSSIPTVVAYQDTGFAAGYGMAIGNTNTVVKDYLKLMQFHRMGAWTNGDVSRVTYDSGTGNVTSWTSADATYSAAIEGTLIGSGIYAGAKSHFGIRPIGSISLDDTKNRAALADWWGHWGAEGWDRDNLFWHFAEPDEPTLSQDSCRLARTRAEAGHDTFGVIKSFATAARSTSWLYAEDAGYESFDDNGIYIPVSTRMSYNLAAGSGYKVPISDYPAAQGHWMYMTNMSHGGTESGDSLMTVGIDWMVDSPPMFTRLSQWMAWYYDATGFLYYDTMAKWSVAQGKDPFGGTWYLGGHGDGTLIYPGVVDTSGRTCGANTPSIGGTHDVPLPSIRLKLMRDSLEDYELMLLAQAATDRATVDAVVNNMFDAVEGTTVLNKPAGCSAGTNDVFTGEGPYYAGDWDNTNDIDTQRAALAALVDGGYVPPTPNKQYYKIGTGIVVPVDSP